MLNLCTEVNDLYNKLKTGSILRSSKSLAIVGGNTDGKTSVIQSILLHAYEEKNEQFYFIDPLNRGVSIIKQTNAKFDDFKPIEILKERLKSNVRKRADRFPHDEDGASVAYHELCEEYEGKYRKLISEVLGFELAFEERAALIKDDPEILILPERQSIEELSSSEISKLRMLIEIDHAINHYECKVIVIDEFDAYLDKNNIAGFYKSLVENYPDTTFVIVLHNTECVVLLEDIDILLLTNSLKKDGEFSAVRFSANEINDVSQIYKHQYRVNSNKVSDFEIRIRDAIRDYVEKGENTDLSEIIDNVRQTNPSARLRVLIDYWERLTDDGD